MNTVELAKWLESRLDKFDEKLDNIKEDQSEIRRVQAEQAKDITHHIKRTDLLEVQITGIADKVEPLKEHLARLKGIAWFLTAVGAVSATVIGVLEYLKP